MVLVKCLFKISKTVNESNWARVLVGCKPTRPGASINLTMCIRTTAGALIASVLNHSTVDLQDFSKRPPVN